MAIYLRQNYWCLCRKCPCCRKTAVGYDLYSLWIAVIYAVCRVHPEKQKFPLSVVMTTGVHRIFDRLSIDKQLVALPKFL